MVTGLLTLTFWCTTTWWRFTPTRVLQTDLALAARQHVVMPTATIRKVIPLTAHDRCDKCGAAAKQRVWMPNDFDLLFCRHHYIAYEQPLLKQGARPEVTRNG